MAREHIGARLAHLAKTSMSNKSVTACTMPASGVRPPFLMFVAVRAIAPVAGMPPKSGLQMLAMPCAISSVLDRCLMPVMPSATTADRSDSIAPKRATDNAGLKSSRNRSHPGHAGR